MNRTWYSWRCEITGRGNHERFSLGGAFVLFYFFFCYAVALYSPSAYPLVMSLNLAGYYLYVLL